MRGIGAYYELHVLCAGEPDPQTGYLVNIKTIDRAVRESVLPLIQSASVDRPTHPPASLMPGLVRALRDALPVDLVSLRWSLTPTYSVEMVMSEREEVLLRQRFEFAAAHRLNVPSLSEEQNRNIFGKCNNPSGHGHNYEFEACVRLRLDDQSFGLPELERIVEDTIITRFDHTHLNLDTDIFKDDAGLNPSVENIARVCYELLAPAIEAGSGNPKLEHVTVWETHRTRCTYPARPLTQLG